MTRHGVGFREASQRGLDRVHRICVPVFGNDRVDEPDIANAPAARGRQLQLPGVAQRRTTEYLPGVTRLIEQLQRFAATQAQRLVNVDG